MVTVGLIGCGRIAERHLEAYRTLEGVRLVVADLDPEAARRLATSHSVDWVPSVDDLWNRKLDAVDVCVPTPMHAEMVLAGLRAGRHVFCEKPLCQTMEQALQIEQLRKTTGLQVQVGYLYRFHPAYQLAQRAISDGVIGAPHLALFRLGGRGNTRAWKHDADAGGGATLEMMVHTLDLVQWLLGPIDDAQLLARRTLLPERHIDGRTHVASAEDYVLARLRAGGAEVVCQSDLATPSYMNYTEVQGDNGTLFTSILSYLPTIIYLREPRGVFNLGNNFYEFPTVNLFELELGHFVRALEGGVEPLNSVQDSIQVLSLIEGFDKELLIGTG